ncbi:MULTISPECIES: hypothetical protein [unclassified Tenacibaculum]|uniref:hypothetical protein n=1 Tax=unclassified Tenacibaculum TaxID=2635139 RepID=UPI001F414820|nr:MULTISPECIES: hypothetical protein [unclassified Tenacibaculum]MCF2874048.1 hypothetical protein [Tenacibaculum sp. Cn5-1]MCF2934630.1 hypothetical protein [Tenacibaculum sp. Cn5-34]MCG7510840.1 hypothetical protein [Tenacibaculum sp. Cn5-46]
MLKNISNLGSILSKSQQKQLTGGCITNKCEPGDDGGGSGITVCAHGFGSTIIYSSHNSCDPNICYGGTVHHTTC